MDLPECLLSTHDETRHQAPSPVKESNSKEENGRKNYFPVPWRVIGGGVRVGIKTDDSDPCSAATVDPASKLDKGTPSTRIISRKRSNSNPPTPGPHSQQFKVEHVRPLDIILMCIQIIYSFHICITQLFSAESPGVL